MSLPRWEVTDSRASAVLADAIRQLQSTSDSARRDAEVLMHAACEIDQTSVIRDPDQLIHHNALAAFHHYLDRRKLGEPIACILGHQEFWSIDLKLNKATLTPRPETEVLVETVLDQIPCDTKSKIVDLGTGCGAIAIALASERAHAQITATDISSVALCQAAENAAVLELQSCFLQSDWFSKLQDTQFDVIVSNPPYIKTDDPALEAGTAHFEPAEALFGGTDGLDCLRTICREANRHLNPGGFLALEHGYDQKDAVAILIKEAGLELNSQIDDYAGLPRVTTALRPET